MCRLQLWRLAKAIFSSLDDGNHSVVTHWLRTHAILEPFIIALHRRISVMHPVSQHVPVWGNTWCAESACTSLWEHVVLLSQHAPFGGIMW
jgi:hypothetical protein